MSKKLEWDTDVPYAVVISFNYRTGETIHTMFEEPDPATQALGWCYRNQETGEQSFLWKDFPASEGWEHFAHWNKAAGEIRGGIAVEELLGTRAFQYVP